jgi:hypothetical protein
MFLNRSAAAGALRRKPSHGDCHVAKVGRAAEVSDDESIISSPSHSPRIHACRPIEFYPHPVVRFQSQPPDVLERLLYPPDAQQRQARTCAWIQDVYADCDTIGSSPAAKYSTRHQLLKLSNDVLHDYDQTLEPVSPTPPPPLVGPFGIAVLEEQRPKPSLAHPTCPLGSEPPQPGRSRPASQKPTSGTVPSGKQRSGNSTSSSSSRPPAPSRDSSRLSYSTPADGSGSGSGNGPGNGNGNGNGSIDVVTPSRKKPTPVIICPICYQQDEIVVIKKNIRDLIEHLGGPHKMITGPGFVADREGRDHWRGICFFCFFIFTDLENFRHHTTDFPHASKQQHSGTAWTRRKANLIGALFPELREDLKVIINDYSEFVKLAPPAVEAGWSMQEATTRTMVEPQDDDTTTIGSRTPAPQSQSQSQPQPQPYPHPQTTRTSPPSRPEKIYTQYAPQGHHHAMAGLDHKSLHQPMFSASDGWLQSAQVQAQVAAYEASMPSSNVGYVHSMASPISAYYDPYVQFPTPSLSTSPTVLTGYPLAQPLTSKAAFPPFPPFAAMQPLESSDQGSSIQIHPTTENLLRHLVPNGTSLAPSDFTEANGDGSSSSHLFTVPLDSISHTSRGSHPMPDLVAHAGGADWPNNPLPLVEASVEDDSLFFKDDVFPELDNYVEHAETKSDDT